MIKILPIISILCVLCFSNCCKKDDHIEIPQLEREHFLLGKWRLVSMEGVPRLQPEVEQYIDFSLIKSGSYEYSNQTIIVYKAEFINYQEEYCFSQQETGDSLFNESGTWSFYPSGNWGPSCTPTELLKLKEGLVLNISNWVGEAWKMDEFTYNRMTLINSVCPPNCYYTRNRTLVFEKQ